MRHALEKIARTAFLVGLVLGSTPWGSADASSFRIVAELAPYQFQNLFGVRGVLAADSAGNLYVEALSNDATGALYELTVHSGYSNVLTIYEFSPAPFTNPNTPSGGVTLTDRDMILGTTNAGGAYFDGTVFNLGTPRKISLTVLHAFSGGQMQSTDAGAYADGLTPGLFNRYYGLTVDGGIGATSEYGSGDGTLFYVSPSSTDPRYSVLHQFGAAGDGIHPTNGNLAVDSQGRLFGMTYAGGANGVGTVFMMQQGNGGWQEQVIYSFQTLNDLDLPTGNVVLDAQGNVYGCGQGSADGGIFRLSPPAKAGHPWQETILYNFGAQHAHDPIASHPGSSDGIGYGCGLAIDPATNLIVGTSYGGGDYGYGTIFTLTPPAPGKTVWKEAVGFSFRKNQVEGYNPWTAPLKVGNTYYGGTLYRGAIYAFTP